VAPEAAYWRAVCRYKLTHEPDDLLSGWSPCILAIPTANGAPRSLDPTQAEGPSRHHSCRSTLQGKLWVTPTHGSGAEPSDLNRMDLDRKPLSASINTMRAPVNDLSAGGYASTTSSG
jgi:hypothetical protein